MKCLQINLIIDYAITLQKKFKILSFTEERSIEQSVGIELINNGLLS